MRKLLMLLTVAVPLAALCGCPKPAADSSASRRAETQVVVADSQVPETAADLEASQRDEAPAMAGKGVEKPARRPSKEELQGKWFALYGGSGINSKTFTYENGHTLEFLSSGIAMWTITGNGGNGLQLASNWSMGGEDITLTVEKAGELSASPVQITPLAFGRDDEVGLTSGGGGGVDTAPVMFRYTPRLAGPYLALEGRNGELMVYGRAESGAAASAPNLSGRWKLKSATGTTEAEVHSSGGDLEITWGKPMEMKFHGVYTNGYFVGSVHSTAGSALAALIPAAGGTLDGVISTEPYNELQTVFELSRDS